MANNYCYIYWIRASHHANIMVDGYIGVSKKPKSRWYWHSWRAKSKKHDNIKLSRAIEKYGWKNLIKEIILIGNEDYCYEMEIKLRPDEQIGWNINKGGSKPPVSKSRGADYVSPLKGKSRPTPWLVGRAPGNAGKPMPDHVKAIVSKTFKGKKQTPEQVAKRVASRRATLAAQGRTV